MAETPWIKLHDDLERVLEDVRADHGIAAVGVWSLLLLEAKRGPVADFGVVRTSVKGWALRTGDEPRPDLWQALIDAALLTLIEGDLSGSFAVRLHEDYFRHQQPRGKSGTERSRESRQRKRNATATPGNASATARNANATECNGQHVACNGDATGGNAEATDCNAEGRGETGDVGDNSPTTPPVAPPSGKHPPMDDVRKVFDHWKATFGLNGNTVLDEKRTRRIRWALKTYGLDDALRAIDGYARDPWDGRRKNCDIALLFRDAGHVESGLAFHDQPPGNGAAPSHHDHEPKATNGYTRNVLNFF